MAPKPIPLPPEDELLEIARSIAAKVERPSRAKLAAAIGMEKSTLNMKLQRDPVLLAKVDVALTARLPDVAELTEEVSEVELLRSRVKELEALTRRDRKGQVMDERITLAVEQAIGERKPKFSPRPIPKSKRSKTRHEFGLLWSDLHAGEVVSREETNGQNHYDWDTMLKRLNRVREALFSYQDNRPYPVEDLHVWGLGDQLSGDIHDELVATNEIPLAEATVQLGMDAAEWLESLLERFPRIHFAGVVGNHPRAHKKPWAKQGYDNADWTAYNVMRLALRSRKQITFDIPKASQHPVEICGRRVLLWHGDGVRSSMPGVPWGGVMRRCNTLESQYAKAGIHIDHFACGHFHQANVVDGGRILMNASIKGVDEYSMKAFGGGSRPQQLLTTFHPRNGLTDASILDCEKT